MTKRIELSQGKFALVDDDDYERISKYKWCAANIGGRFVAERNVGVSPFRKIVIMAREIMNAPKGVLVDHISGDTLDNRKSNLRLCTQRENLRNRGKTAKNTSGFKGVAWYKKYNNWRVQIKTDGKVLHVGYYDDVESAARAYDEAARKYHGEFARTNF